MEFRNLNSQDTEQTIVKPGQLCILFITMVLGLQTIGAGTERWKSDLRYPVRFQRLLAHNLLLVSTQRHTFALDPDSGQTMWRFRNLEIFPEDIYFFPERDLLLISEGWGGVMEDKESTLLAVRASTGKLVWESRPLPVKVVDLMPTSTGDQFLAVAASLPHQKRGDRLFRRLKLYLLDNSTGELQWARELQEPSTLTPLGERKGSDGRNYHFYGVNAYWPPQFTDRFVYLFYNGVHCLDLSSGELRWKHAFRTLEEELVRSTAQPLLTSDRLYASGKERAFALHPHTGEMLWNSPSMGLVSTLHETEKGLYARIGGQFFDLSSNKWEASGSAGLVRLDKSDGRPLWKWNGAGGSISNVILNGSRLYSAGERRVFILHAETGRVVMSFPHKMDPSPRFIGLNEISDFVLLGDGQAASFDRTLATPLWSHRLESPESGLWKSLTGGLLSVAGSLMVAASYGLNYQREWLPDIPAPLGDLLDYERRVIRMGRLAGISLLGTGRSMMRDNQYSEIENARLYALSRDPSKKEWGILSLNLNNGQIDQFVSLDPFETRFIISDSLRRVFRVKDSTIYAIDFLRDSAPLLRENLQQSLARPGEESGDGQD